ncbi:hypothetical protein RM553_03900 [Zunongwangia sp. F363]|uniref:Secreted protein n=1 Tax=Autumnicola tepida TaxID=3075595 RepID=A0ABU3C6Z6_9FLAO|nr:hypothetical protein [Zunongwangia sp. F363]MDT0641967.1 hypothetical protein [Zunongwangia sp. F363]
MKKFISKTVFFLILAAGMFSCKDAEAEKEPASTPSVESSYLNKEKSTNSEVAYNPAHGQPNHRCDLPVGAPLGKATTNASAPASTQSPVRLKSATPKVNPPHGEPGHDCSVPVGAELN